METDVDFRCCELLGVAQHALDVTDVGAGVRASVWPSYDGNRWQDRVLHALVVDVRTDVFGEACRVDRFAFVGQEKRGKASPGSRLGFGF